MSLELLTVLIIALPLAGFVVTAMVGRRTCFYAKGAVICTHTDASSPSTAGWRFGGPGDTRWFISNG